MDRGDVALIRSKNTKRIHSPGCPAVRQMKMENRLWLALDEVKKAEGLVKCKWCKAKTGQSIFK